MPETSEEAARVRWNASADRFNQWDSLGQDERVALIAAESESRAGFVSPLETTRFPAAKTVGPESDKRN